MKRVFTNPHILSLTGNILASLSGFLSIWILTRLFPPTELGEWMLYLTVFSLADMLRSGSIQTAFIHQAVDRPNLSVKGAAWFIALVLSLLLSIIYYVCYHIFPGIVKHSEYTIYLPVLFLVSLPVNIAIWFRQVDSRFGHILYLRLLVTLPFLIFISSGFLFSFGVVRLIQVQILCYAFASAIAIVLGWADVFSVLKVNKQTVGSLLNFGKYSMGTLMGTNLLKSSDVFIINWFLGPSAVALYTLPYKLIELVEIPLRSFAATALPQLSKHCATKNIAAAQLLFNKSTGFLTLLLIPFALVGFLLAESILGIIAGKSYAVAADVFRCFIIYSLFLPLDRFIGISLDCFNKPHLNLFKVLSMAIINIVGSIVVITIFHSALAVAGITILTIIFGVSIGFVFLSRIMPVKAKNIFQEGFQLIHLRSLKMLFHKV